MPKNAKPPPPRIRIGSPAPMIDCGALPVKAHGRRRRLGERGHLRRRARHPARGRAVAGAGCAQVGREPDGAHRRARRRRPLGGLVRVEKLGRHRWTIEAWADAFASWVEEMRRKMDAGQSDLSGELSEGEILLEQAAERARNAKDRQRIERALACLRDEEPNPEIALDPELFEIIARYPDRSRSTTMDADLHVDVDRGRARFGAWYELFPRSWGGLKGSEKQIPALADLGFDVLYLPPVHPIGLTNRKGVNNALVAAPGDPGSPWAIGDASGGHTALHPGPGDDGRLRCPRGDRPGARRRHRAGLRDPVLGRPPLADRASRVVQPAPRRHAEVRREPAEEVPGHLQRQLGLSRLAVAVERAARRPEVLGRPRRQCVPGRQSPYEAAGVLGVGHRRAAHPSTRRSSSSPRPSRGRR